MMMTAKLIQRNNTSGCAFGRVFPTLGAGASEASRERQQQEVEEEGEGVTGRQWHECEMPTGDIRVPVSGTSATSSSSLPQRRVRTSVGGAGGANEGTPKPYPKPYPNPCGGFEARVPYRYNVAHSDEHKPAPHG